MNKYHKKNIKAYNKKASDYDNTLDGKLTEKFKSLLLGAVDVKDGDSVLDIGCGNGTLLSRIAKIKSIRGFGTDISPEMVKNATARHPQLEFVASGCDNIPFDDNSMDIITVCAAYHHFPNIKSFAAEAKRLLKENGNLYIAEIYLPPVIRHIANIFLPLSKSGDVRLYSPKEIIDTFSDTDTRFRFVKSTITGHIQVIHFLFLP